MNVQKKSEVYKEMKEKVIIILGAYSCIGEATVRVLAAKGAKLVIASRSEGSC